MKVTVVPNVTGKINNIPENMSIVKSAILFANELTKCEVAKVNVCGFPQVETGGTLAEDHGLLILYLWRPGDLLAKSEMAKRADHIFMLFHEQDKFITDFEALKNLLQEKKLYMFNPEFANWVRDKTGLKIDTSIEHPVEPIPDAFDVSGCIKRIQRSEEPNITLWASPSVRKNSVEGLFGCLDALSLYRERATLNVVSNISSGNLLESRDLLSIPRNVNLVEIANPSYSTLYSVLGGTHVMVLPSVDEGFHLPVYESSRFGTSVICADIPTNRYAKRRNPNVCTVSLIENGLICGHPHEEIGKAFKLGVLNYKELVESILDEIKSFQSISSRMADYMKKGHLTRQMWRIEEQTMQKTLGLSYKKSPGRAPVIYL